LFSAFSAPAEQSMKEEIDDFVPKIIDLSFRKCREGWRLPSHFQSGSEILYVIEGKGRYVIEGKSVDKGKTHDLEPGDLLCRAEGQSKKAVIYPGNSMCFFSVNFTSLEPAPGSQFPSLPLINHIGLRKDLIDLFRELTISWDSRQSGYIMKTRALLMRIVHRLYEIIVWDVDSKKGDHRINKATLAIMQNYSGKLTVKDLARQADLDEAYFGRLFKQTMGMSVRDYIKHVRVRNAETMLQSGDYKVHEVAGYCGFSNVSHFFNSFRSLRGFSPSKCIPRSGHPNMEDL